MPLFEINEGELVPFRRLKGGAELYEAEIEELLWANLEEFTGEALFPIARQPSIGGGGRPDIVALDESARVVVIEVKRDIDRGQLAQCLEYAGWARKTSLDELAGLYPGSSDGFFAAWQEFTESTAPVVINPHPRLMLVARDLHQRTESAFDFLIESGVPVKVIRVSIYEDQAGRRFVDVEGEHEPDLPVVDEGDAVDHTKIAGRRVRVDDLIEYELVTPGDELVFERPKLGRRYEAVISENGSITLSDGRTFSSPSRAAMEAADVPAYDGWYAWRVVRNGKLLNELRMELAEIAAIHDQ